MLAGCSNIDTGSDAGVSDIEDSMKYSSVSHMAFMGGSVLYNPKNAAMSQLAKNVCVATRLGKVTREDIDDTQTIFKDDEEAQRFGFIKINSIDSSKITFSYTEYSQDGKNASEQLFSLKRDESIDINGDGLADLKYTKPSIRREGLENSLWLTFLSSQDDLNTSMFSVIPDQYSRSVYPNGLLGINPDGRFLVNKYDVGTTNRAAIAGISYGDYVLDSETGRYQKFIGTSLYRSARAINDSELETTTSDIDVDFRFTAQDFTNAYSSQKLLETLPQNVTADYEVSTDTEKNIEILNLIISDRNFAQKLYESKSIEFDEAEVATALNNISQLSDDELISFNRLLMTSLFSELCPPANSTGTDITEVLPLLYVNFSENAPQQSEADFGSERSIINTAKNYGEYENKKEQIDKLFKEFHLFEIDNRHYKFEGLKKFLGAEKDKENYSDSTVDMVYSYEDMKKVSGYLKINKPAVIENGATLKLGVMGHFKITFSNIEAGLYGGLYVKAESEFSTSKTLLSYSKNAIPSVNLITLDEKLIDVNLKFFDFPPINIGVVSLQASANGGIQIPAKIKFSGNLLTTVFIGYTGFYAIGLDIGANYGIKYKTLKVFKTKIKIPRGISVSPYAKPTTVCENVFFAGPAGDLKNCGLIKLKSAKFECEVNPYIYIEPRLSVCKSVFAGMRIGPGFDIGAGVKIVTDESTLEPKYIDVYGILGGGVKFAATYGIDITFPIIRRRWTHTDVVDIKSVIGKEREEYSLCKIEL